LGREQHQFANPAEGGVRRQLVQPFSDN
jgi:hypothetical protein